MQNSEKIKAGLQVLSFEFINNEIIPTGNGNTMRILAPQFQVFLVIYYSSQ